MTRVTTRTQGEPEEYEWRGPRRDGALMERGRKGYRRRRRKTTEKNQRWRDGLDASLPDGIAGLTNRAERARVDGRRVRGDGEHGS